MTTDRDYYGDFEPSTIIRNGRNGMPYAIQNEHRYVPSNVDRPRTGSRGYQETNDHDGDGSKQNQRRRIPIACGRCRKRKIRCSGAQGDSGCQNCKTAGNDNCQFNRVQAHDVTFTGTDLSFGGLGTMANHLPLSSAGRTQYIDVGMPTPAWMMPMSSSSRLPFRQGSLGYPRPGAYGGQYGDYPEEIGYNSMAYPPPPMHHDSLDVGYGSGNIPPPPPPRSFTPGPPLVHKHQNMSCYEPSGSYPQQTQHAQSHQQLSQYGIVGQSFALPLRSNALPSLPAPQRMYELPQDGIENPSTTHSSTCQQQHHLPPQNQPQMTSITLSTRRSQGDLQNDLNVSGHDGKSLGASLLSNGQVYETWGESPPQAQQHTMNMNRMLDHHGEELRQRTSVQALSGVRV